MKTSRRQFLNGAIVASGTLLAEGWFAISSRGFSALEMSGGTQQEFEEGFIRIRNPRELGVDRLAAERVPIGGKGFHKPSHVKLHGDELLLVCYEEDDMGYASTVNPQVYQLRSTDGGRSWIGPEWLHVDDTAHGAGEPYLFKTQNGTLLMTGGPWGYRSEDDGRTWTKRLEPKDFAEKASCNVTRNFLQLKDGSLLQIVDFTMGRILDMPVMGHEFVARSRDDGRSWPETYPCRVEGVPKNYDYVEYDPWGTPQGYSGSVFNEGYLWQSPSSGKLYCLARIDTRYYPLPGRVLTRLELASAEVSVAGYCFAPVSRVPQPLDEMYFDQFDRLKIFTSNDVGRTWQPGPDLGDYGYMYPSILQLQDGRLLLTYTVRSIDPPLGVRAVVGKEGNDGLQFDFDHDVIMIDTRTPIGRQSGGGFGPTIQLDDGSLVTSYSYWPPNDKRKPCDLSLPHITLCEVARWRLPAAK